MPSTPFGTRSRGLACVVALLVTPAALAEPFVLDGCDGTPGIAVTTYSKTNGPDVSAVTETTEVCWIEATATLISQETSRGLQPVADQGGVVQYQRLDGGTVSPLNEQLALGAWENRPEAQSPYFRWTTESSRAPDTLNGFDSVTAEGFLVSGAGFTPPPDAAVYDMEMQLTGVGGSITAMVYNLFLPMNGTATVDDGRVDVTLDGYMEGMGPQNVALSLGLADTDRGFESAGALTMDNGLMAGAPGPFWSRLDLTLDEMFPMYSGAELSFVASFSGEAVSFDGARAPVAFTLVGNGVRRD
ncbi:MAG: hypothetical protein HLUCCA08_11220 [Rhodobacteraceae bacterium HLUCCA08]|nr:MAG: hypothetical protein HLUCCA08_11220 [Rhodobacteraceae bacterium HLUCCA08]